jgi:phosphoglycerate dehydrogenase-like enzyme
MISEPLTVWCNLGLPARALEALQTGLGMHHLVQAQEIADLNQPVGRPDPQLPAADIAFGQPEADQCVRSTRLRWVQLTSASYTTFATTDVMAALSAKGVPVTTSSSVYDEPCAQHALAFMLAEARQLPRSWSDQLGAHAWNTPPTRAASFLLRNQTVLLVGFGAIGRRLAQLLAPFGLRVLGFRRHPSREQGADVRAVGELDTWLPHADWVVNLLPASVDTAGFFDFRRFSVMKPGAVFMNIGRGFTVDQDALLGALRGHLRAAYLDVTVPEPLPPPHPLWSAPNCFVTPHVAGGHDDEYERLVALLLENLERFLHAQPLLGRVY